MKKISFSLSEKELSRAIRELEQYKRALQEGLDVLREKVAERIAWSAARGFSLATADDLLGEEAPRSDVQVSVKHDGALSVVIAEGKDAVFIEFGAGVFSNGPAGASPHPWGAALGMTIGGYGEGKGARTVWGFRGEDGEIHLSRGVPSAMPMYRAAREALREIEALAEEVFS